MARGDRDRRFPVHPWWMRRGRAFARTATVLLLLPLLVACGGDDDDENDEPAPVTPVASSRLATPAGAVAGDQGSPEASPAGSTAPATFGDLADRVNAAWAGVRSYQLIRTSEVLTSGGTPEARSVASSPVAGDAPLVASPIGPAATPSGTGVTEVAEEAIIPDRRRQVTRIDGVVASETITIDGRIWARGVLARFARPDADESTWVAIDPASFPAGSQLAALFDTLTAPISPPFPDVPASARTRELIPVGPVEVEGRTCEAYRFAETTETGERFDIVVAVGADDRLCSIETEGRGIRGVTRFIAYDLPLAIEPPADAASPVAGSPAAATPIASPVAGA